MRFFPPRRPDPVPPVDLQAIWTEHAARAGLLERRPDPFFDPDFYAARHPDLAAAGTDLRRHHARHGKRNGVAATEYQEIVQQIPDFDVGPILTPSDLKTAVTAGQSGAAETAFEILKLGGDVDMTLSDFSRRQYLQRYPDVKAAGITPLRHFLCYGEAENRVSLGTIRRNLFTGGRPTDPARRTLLLAVHEFSLTGAPLVARDLLRAAAQTYNVVVLSLRGGPLLESFRRDATAVLITDTPHEDIDFALPDLGAGVDYALLNSTDASPFIKMLVGRDIPFAAYMHEYTAYSLPRHKTMFPSYFADLMVFSSQTLRDDWRGLHEDLGLDPVRDTCVVPQARLSDGGIRVGQYDRARAAVGRHLGCDLTGRRLVYGAGTVHWRKGTDLFFMAAQIARDIDPSTVHVWIGDGLSREDPHIGVWMHQHMEAAGVGTPGATCFHLPAGEIYGALVQAADAMLLTSRLDPLPNVVFDAVQAGCDVVLFDGATGFDDPQDRDHPRLHRVPYGRLDRAVQTLADLPPKGDRLDPDAAEDEDPAPQDTGAAFAVIDARMTARLRDALPAVSGEGAHDLSLLFSGGAEDLPYRIAERRKAWTLGRRTIWKSAAEAQAVLDAADHPVVRNMSIRPFAAQPARDLPAFSVHIHAYYIDDLEQDLRGYLAFRHAARLVVTTDTPDKAKAIEAILHRVDLRAEVRVVDNRGRDILPFLHLFETAGPGDAPDDIWAHVHHKKSVETEATGDVWRRFILRILLGGEDHLSNALTAMAQGDVGLVAPFDPLINGWYGAKPVLPSFQRLVQTPLPDHPVLYPVGNMFWTRRSVIDRMTGYFGPDYPWPNEPIANDGTVYHMIERLWPTATFEAGLKSVFVSKPDQPRR